MILTQLEVGECTIESHLVVKLANSHEALRELIRKLLAEISDPTEGEARKELIALAQKAVGV